MGLGGQAEDVRAEVSAAKKVQSNEPSTLPAGGGLLCAINLNASIPGGYDGRIGANKGLSCAPRPLRLGLACGGGSTLVRKGRGEMPFVRCAKPGDSPRFFDALRSVLSQTIATASVPPDRPDPYKHPEDHLRMQRPNSLPLGLGTTFWCSWDLQRSELRSQMVMESRRVRDWGPYGNLVHLA